MEYIQLNGTGSPANFSAYFSYYSNLKVVFHDTIETNIDRVNTAILERIDADLNCTEDIDPEVKQRWYPVGLSLNYTPVYEPAHTWISSMGRSKYVTPVYQSLQDSNQHDLAVQWNDENKDFYHPVTETSVMKILNGVDKVKTVEEEVESEFDFDSIADRIVEEFGRIQKVTEITEQAFGFLH